MSVLIEDKSASGTRSFVASYFAFYHFISRLVFFVFFLAFIPVPGTQRIFSAW